MTSQTFCYHFVEYIKLDTCVKFHDHQSYNNKVMMKGPYAPSPMTDGSKKPMSNRVKDQSKLSVNEGDIEYLMTPRMKEKNR